ncbi:MAG: farnesyl-diphosphate farnesyltransferase [Verrucomicrobia bacterium]|nr:farnesyl-diphosphate farnesyltransferase [Verrucomicrobiota bacterium]
MRGPSLPPPLLALLEGVSRSFYLTLRMLPAPVRPQIGLAYLLARAADTIADTAAVPPGARWAVLEAYRLRIQGRTTEPVDLRPIASGTATGAEGAVPGDLAGSPSNAEGELLERTEELLAFLDKFQPPDQERIRTVLDVITSGQQLDLERFAEADPGHVVALEREADLDDYTYRVAGSVGEFWTRVCRAHLFPDAPLDEAGLLARAVRFGRGLQLVNILRDLAADLRQGRCYLPRAALAAAGLTPATLLDPGCLPRLRPLYDGYLDQAEAHLAAGWSYTQALPRSQVRVRLACAWPILIGLETLGRLRQGDVLDPRRRLKISRADVRRLVFHSVVCYPWSAAWNRLYDRARRRWG